MSLTDIFTLIIALWGAGLATFLGIRELSKEKRRIQITLERVIWAERLRLNITNVGHRPITITAIGLSMVSKGYKQGEAIPAGAYYANDDFFQPPNFPFTLTDGQMIYVYLSNYFMEGVYIEKKKIVLEVYDAEGRIYSKYKRSDYDSKWGFYHRKE